MEICVLVWWVQIWAVCFLLLRLCVMQKRWTDGLYMHGCHWSMGEEVLVWECFAECTLNQHGSHRSEMLFHQTSRLTGVFTKEDSLWPGLQGHPTKPNWDFLGSDGRQNKEKGTSRSQHLWSLLQDCCKSISGDHTHSENANQECVNKSK